MYPKIQILSNTNYALADVLKSEFIESTHVQIAVAFLRKTGLDYILKSLEYALKENQAKVEFIVGLDFKTTDAEALEALNDIKKQHTGFNFYCFGDKRDNHNDLVFHPKIYMFHTELSKSSKYTSIVGSSNFTGGGLSTNFEVNTIFKEAKPLYFKQLEAIYNEIKFTDSVFCPSLSYIKRYGAVKNELDKTTQQVFDNDIKNEITSLRSEEQVLPGTVPSLKKIIIDYIKQKNEEGIASVSTKELYVEIEQIIIKLGISNRYKMETFTHTLRGELNTHELESTHKSNMKLFKREERGFYSLTEIGKNYDGR